MTFRLVVAAAAAFAMFAPSVAMAMDDECFDLWVARNSIYDENGYCFKTQDAKDYFDNSDCWTSKPKFSKKEWATILAIKDVEEELGCI